LEKKERVSELPLEWGGIKYEWATGSF